MENQSLPKVLIVGTCNFEHTDATSQTIKNLFSRWDKDRVAVIHADYSGEIEHLITDNTFSLGLYPRNKFLSLFKKSKYGKKIRQSASVVIGVQGVGISQYNSLKSRLFNFIHTFFSAHISIIKHKYPASLYSFVEIFQPDVIYSPLGTVSVMQLTYTLSKKYKLPVFPHFMDDWINTLYKGNLLLLIPSMTKNKYLHKLMNNATEGGAISELMAKEYSSRFGIPFSILMNCVDIHNSSYLVPDQKKHFVFSYCGGLHLNRWQSLILLCQSIKDIPFEKETKVEIYTKETDWVLYGNYFSEFSFVEYKGFLSPEELYEKQLQHDVLIHVESFDKTIIPYTRLSISTKIPEYLALKKIIIAIGPPQIASIEYLRENKCAYVIDVQNQEEIHKVLLSLKTKAHNIQLINNAYLLFLKNHTLESQCSLLKDRLIQAIKENQI